MAKAPHASRAVTHHLHRRMLIIPESIKVQLTTNKGENFKQENIILGIQTYATRKNNIELSPFISNSDGIVLITKDQIIERAENFISYGIMDYSSLETAKPSVHLYVWTKEMVKQYLNYWEPIIAKNPVNKLKDWQISGMGSKLLSIQNEQRTEFNNYKNSYNLHSISNSSRVSLNWDGTEKNSYTTLKIK
jgi:hypothetical protein